MSNEILAAAIDLARAGLSVVPVRASEKYPAVPWKEFQARRADPVELEAWFAELGDLRIGVVTGPISRILVLDVDYRHGGGASIDEARLELAAIATVRSPGGRHYWFRYPANRLVRSQNGWRKGVDKKADRSIALVPPSPGYQWEKSYLDGPPIG